MNKGFQIRISSGPGRGLTHPIDTEVLKIGRAAGPNQRAEEGRLYLHDDAVSRLHAELRWRPEQDKYELAHRSGTNLTYVNGEPITECILEVGDEIKVGGVTLELQQADRRWGGEPDTEVTPMSQRQDLQRPPSRSTFAVRAPLEPARAPEPIKRKVSLGAPGGGRLVASDGQEFELKGSLLRIGCPASEEDEPVGFDSEFVIDGQSLSYRNAIVRWDELKQAYIISRGPGPEGLRVRLARQEGGLLWTAEVLENNQGQLRDQDRIFLGEGFHIVFHSGQPESSKVAKIQI